jgi:hypothetical protein
VRILITGLTPQQCGNGTRHGYRAVVDLYAAALRWAGHTVDHRAWTPGDDLTQYDAAIIGIVPFNSIAARHVYVVCDVIGRARQSGCGLVFMVDDWNFMTLRTSVRSINKDTQRLFTTIKGRTYREWAETPDGRAMIDLVMNAMDTRPWPATLFPAFSWGDHSRFKLHGAAEIPAREIVALDPTVFADPYELVKAVPDERKRSWVMGTLSNQQPWIAKLGLTWDVNYVGAKASKAERSVKESELIQMYAESWGVLSAPYKRILGTGWWRNRFVYAARAGAVLMCDPAEAPQLGPAYQLDHAVEILSNDELTELAVAQADALRAHVWPADQLVSELERVLTGSRDDI